MVENKVNGTNWQSWIVKNDLYNENFVWLIQLPRLYNIYKEMGNVTSFQNILDNIFLPLFEENIDNLHRQLHVFLKHVALLEIYLFLNSIQVNYKLTTCGCYCHVKRLSLSRI